MIWIVCGTQPILTSAGKAQVSVHDRIMLNMCIQNLLRRIFLSGRSLRVEWWQWMLNGSPFKQAAEGRVPKTIVPIGNN